MTRGHVHACLGGACIARGHVCLGSVHGWRGMCGLGGVHAQWACVAGGVTHMSPPTDSSAMAYGQ